MTPEHRSGDRQARADRPEVSIRVFVTSRINDTRTAICEQAHSSDQRDFWLIAKTTPVASDHPHRHPNHCYRAECGEQHKGPVTYGRPTAF